MQKLDRSGIAASIGLPVNGSAPAPQAFNLPI
ncbi:RNA-binding protein 39-like, partial [Trifolium medium]|nr:RNA-binding protein 39-like [Trifolium medium]